MSAGPVLAHAESSTSTAVAPWVLLVLLVVVGAVALARLLHPTKPGPAGRAGVLTGGMARAVRGMLVAGASLSTSLSGHLLAGQPPAVTSELLTAVVVLVVGCWGASSVRWTFPRLLVATGVAEPAFHVLFEMSPTDGAAPPSVAGAAAGLLTDPMMLAGHAAAAVILAAVLAHGEALAFDLMALLTAAIARCFDPVGSGPVLQRPAGLRDSDVRKVPRPSLVLLVSAPRRGPPQGAGVG